MLTPRFEAAFQYAAMAHGGQLRKGTTVPYLSHLMAVAGLVLEFGGDEDAAIAALLHDVVEDCGGPARAVDVRVRFGPHVAHLVDECTDTDETPKPPWRDRKERYIAHLDQASPEGRLVSACDKLHNSRTIVRSLRHEGASTWAKFRGGCEGTLWYYATITAAFRRLNVPTPLVEELERCVADMHRLAGFGQQLLC